MDFDKNILNFLMLFVIVANFQEINANIFSKAGLGSTLYCYKCVSTHPGCGDPFSWLWYWSQECPEENDKCVKLIERKGVEVVVTRDCLSSFKALRTDIPADHYEGCRAATVDVKLAHYVNNSITSLDIKRNYYDETTWCFCHFDNRCNDAHSISSYDQLRMLFPLMFLYLTNYLFAII